MSRCLRLILAGVVLAAAGVTALAWRFEQGPLPIPWLAQRAEAVLNAPGGATRLEIGGASVTWAGWREGHRSPLGLFLQRVRLVEPDGSVRAELPDAMVSLSVTSLLRGQVALRGMELRGLELRAVRAADGAFRLDLGTLGGEAAGEAGSPVAEGDGALLTMLAELMQPPTEGSPVGALQSLRLLDARLTVADAQLGRVWSAELGWLAMTRRHGGGIDLAGSGVFTLGGEQVPLVISGMVEGTAFRGHAALTLPAIRPAALARASPALGALAALDAQASATLAVRLEGLRIPSEAEARLRVGPGVIDLGDRGRIPLRGLEADAALADGRLQVDSVVLRTAAPPGAIAPAPTITGTGRAQQTEAGWRGEATLRVDQVAFADLGHYWPTGIAHGAREWIADNITGGVVRGGEWRLGLEGDPASGRIAVTSLEGSATAEDAEVHWLRPIPPAQQVRGVARFGRDAIELEVRGGRQAGGAIGVRDGRIRFAFDTEPESAEITLQLDGSLPDVWTLLRHPRLHLFDSRPPPVPAIFGTLREARLQLAFPLISDLPVERLRVSATGRATEVRVPRALLGKDLERGAFEFSADTEGLRINGTGVLAGIPLRIQQEADFRPGNANQVVAREVVTGRADARQIAGLGLDPRPFVEGQVGIDSRSETRRNGQTRVRLRTDFTQSRLAVDALSWAKPPGVTSAGEAMLILQNGTLQRIEGIRVTAPDALLRGTAGETRDNIPGRIEIQQAQFGRNRMTGEIFPPRSGSAGWQLALRGPVLDLAPVLAAPPPPPAAGGEEGGGQSVSVEARFDRMLLREDRALTGVTASARVNGQGVVNAAEVRGRVDGGGDFDMRITPEGGGRRFLLTSEDGGALLRAFGVLRTIQGGRLTVDATYPHSRAGAPLTGAAELENFAVRDAPALAKLLQAMTVYGVFDALSAQGLAFASLTAPFTLTRESLVLNDARAFSVSLGITAKGRIDRLRETIDMEGTIVPAYVFNSLLGRIPILGRVFSPERGGGLFAATYRMRGPLADPNISVNPLAALTPGFLRGVFGLGQDAAPTTPR
ncbi:AsmA-like C-terminal region-containing protein [Roseomonas sp. JC162]|uniref:AsmA-like C-terminal region-containing protein n=1 Tax=Neoroseomonas marina TaxID=1232220 RepID=A0A848E805_9PROT|nr:AsmA-like C-terminal region-containing protein [Neoroseomonas marina]